MSPQIQASVRIHLRLVQVILWLILLMDIFGGKGAVAADVVLSCPSNFTDGEVSNLTCTVNITRVSSAGCFPTPSKIEFRFTYSAGISSRLCSPTYPQNETSCAPQTTPGDCFCANKSGEILTYQYNFVAGTGYQGGSFACSICEVGTDPPQQDISPNCKLIQIVTTTTSAATTVSAAQTTTAATTSSPNTTGNCTASPICPGWSIALIVLNVVFIIPCGAFIVIIIIIKKMKEEKVLCIAIIVGLLILALGVITLIVTLVKSDSFFPTESRKAESCHAESDKACSTASLVLGCISIFIGLVMLALVVVIRCKWKKPTEEGQMQPTVNSQGDSNRDPEKNKKNQEAKKGTEMRVAPQMGQGDPQHTGSHSSVKL